MTLDKVKKLVNDNLGIMHSFRFKGARNQIEEFRGMITNIYPSIFIITIDNEMIRSFSYSDLLIDNLEIIS